MPNKPPSFLGGMGRQERAASVVLALKSQGNLPEIYVGGERQFLQIARPILRNWGVKSDDYGTIWAMIGFAVQQPAAFLRMCEEMDARKRVLAN